MAAILAIASRELQYSEPLKEHLQSMTPHLRELANAEIYKSYEKYGQSEMTGDPKGVWISNESEHAFTIWYTIAPSVFSVLGIEIRKFDDDTPPAKVGGVFCRVVEGELQAYALSENAPMQFGAKIATTLWVHENLEANPRLSNRGFFGNIVGAYLACLQQALFQSHIITSFYDSFEPTIGWVDPFIWIVDGYRDRGKTCGSFREGAGAHDVAVACNGLRNRHSFTIELIAFEAARDAEVKLAKALADIVEEFEIVIVLYHGGGYASAGRTSGKGDQARASDRRLSLDPKTRVIGLLRGIGNRRHANITAAITAASITGIDGDVGLPAVSLLLGGSDLTAEYLSGRSHDV